MIEQKGRFRVDVYGSGKKKFFVVGERDEPLVPDESRFFEVGEVVSAGQFPDFGVFAIDEKEGEPTLIMRTTDRIFIRDGETKILKKLNKDEDLEQSLRSGVISMVSLKTNRQIVITQDKEPPEEVAIGALPKSPPPTLIATVAQHPFGPDKTRRQPGSNSDWLDREY